MHIRNNYPIFFRDDITKHPNFQYTADADDKNAFDIEAFLSTRLKPKPNEVYDVFEVDVDTEGE